MGWRIYFEQNRPIILFIYGQVFFVLGLAILLQSRHHSRLTLARDLRWLGFFGILHGLHEWGLVFIPIQAQVASVSLIRLLEVLQLALLVVSFACLLQFGLVLQSWTRNMTTSVLAAMLGMWGMVCVVAFVAAPDFHNWLVLSSIWARYLLAVPGTALASYGLFKLSDSQIVAFSGTKFQRMLRVASYSLVAYGLFAGLFVPYARFFPASIINQATLEAIVQIPVALFRSAAGLVLTISIIRSLEMFEVEVDRLIENMEIEALRASERERIGQEIHDGALQGVYSTGLILESMRKHVADNPLAAARLQQAEQVVSRVISDLRLYMVSLRLQSAGGSLVERIVTLAGEPRIRSLVDIKLELAIYPQLDAYTTGHLVALVREALSNAVRHAAASTVTIRLEDGFPGLALEVRDDGRGYDSEVIVEGFGLQSMREHALNVGAVLEVNSILGKGTSIHVRLPGDEAG